MDEAALASMDRCELRTRIVVWWKSLLYVGSLPGLLCMCCMLCDELPRDILDGAHVEICTRERTAHNGPKIATVVCRKSI